MSLCLFHLLRRVYWYLNNNMTDTDVAYSIFDNMKFISFQQSKTKSYKELSNKNVSVMNIQEEPSFQTF